ncbi:MAG: cytochrome c oxidase subunit II [Elusimicrobia bacterium]|nr:cytochrome c oxidase subunit II [Elusimicrobiota bacterium]
MTNFAWALPEAASTFAHQIDFGIYLIHAAMLGIFILWGTFFVYLLVKYRARPGVPAEREDHDDTPAQISVPDSFSKFPFGQILYRHKGELKSLIPDMVIMLFEIALIVFYAIPVWSRIKASVPASPDALKVEIISEQFAWNIHYAGPDGKFGARRPELVHFSNSIGLDRSDPASADDVVMGNEMHLPVGRPAIMKLTSKDVIHSFFVPEFRLKQDAMPGMEIPMWVEPTKVGKYEIACAQLCGFAHSHMRGDMIVQTQEEFDAWYKSRLAAIPAAPAPANSTEEF